MVIKGFEDVYFVEKLYFDCGMAIIDYLYSSYTNLADRQKLMQLCEKLTESNKRYIGIYDNIGRSFTLLCNMIAKRYNHKSVIFLYRDDISSTDKLMGVYISKKNLLIALDKSGINISTYYYHSATIYQVEKYLTMAESYFEKSEYIAKNSGL